MSDRRLGRRGREGLDQGGFSKVRNVGFIWSWVCSRRVHEIGLVGLIWSSSLNGMESGTGPESWGRNLCQDL